MELPSWEKLKVNYPSMPAKAVFKKIGGKVELNYDLGIFSNACATRISFALNAAGQGHKIPFYKAVGPNGKFEGQVSSGSEKNWYIFRVKILTKYLSDKYGKPKVYSSSDYASSLIGRKGIIIFEVHGWSDATGHADLWDGEKTVYQDYGRAAHKVKFWEAKK